MAWRRVVGMAVIVWALVGTVGSLPLWARTARASKQPAATVPDPARAAAPAAKLEVPLQVPDAVAKVGWLELSGPLREGPPPVQLMGGEAASSHTFRHILQRIRDVARQDAFTGLVIYIDDPELSLSQVYELGQAIAEVQAAGKVVMSYAESYDMIGYLLACQTDKILLQHQGQIELTGLGTEEIYVAGLLAKLGVKADFLQVGQFKGADEWLTRNGPSEAWNGNIDAVLDDLYAQIIDTIAGGRSLTHQDVEKLFADCWTMTDDDYVNRGVVDLMTDRDLAEATGPEWGTDFTWEDLLTPTKPPVNMENPFALLRKLFQPAGPAVHRPSIALIHALGPITRGDSQMSAPGVPRTDSDPLGGMFGAQSAGSRTIIDAINEARDNDLIKGVVIRVDSPGGSAQASEVMWQAIHALAEEKPVYVSVGAMAASGGYYIACAADEIWVHPTTIIGSIGVVGGKITLGGLYEKLGVSVFRRSRGPLGDMFNSVAEFTPQQRAAMQSAFDLTYKRFTQRVELGRGERIKDLSKLAEGRLFTGQQAVENGLADEIGSVDDVIAALAEDCKLEEGKYDVVDLPAPPTLGEFMEGLLGELAAAPTAAGDAGAAAAMTRAVQAALGPRGWKAVAPVLQGVMLLRREPVLTIMPIAIVVK